MYLPEDEQHNNSIEYVLYLSTTSVEPHLDLTKTQLLFVSIPHNNFSSPP